MSFLEKTDLGAAGYHFYFHGQHYFGKLLDYFIAPGIAHADVQPVYSSADENVHYTKIDKRNSIALQEQLDVVYAQNKMKDEFMRGNNVGENDIKNHQQNQQFVQYQKINALLSIFFLYFIHLSYWKQWPTASDTAANDVTTYTNQTMVPTGKSLNSIMENVKSIYPAMYNMFATILEGKFPGQAKVALMKIQDMQSRVTEITNLGKNPVLSVKKAVKIKALTN